MKLELPPDYFPKEPEGSEITTFDAAVLARCNQAIKDNPGPVKKFIVKYAKDERGKDITEDEITDIKANSYASSASHIKFAGAALLNDERSAHDSVEDSKHIVNNKGFDVSWPYHFEKREDISANWQLTSGFTVGHNKQAEWDAYTWFFANKKQLVMKGYTPVVWDKDFTLTPGFEGSGQAILTLTLGSVQLRADWQVLGGDVHCSCVIHRCGKHPEKAKIPVRDILVSQRLSTLGATGQMFFHLVKDHRAILVPDSANQESPG